jgi:hypothetical protein
MPTSALKYLLSVFCLPLGLIGGCQMKQTSASENTKVVWGRQAEGLRCALAVANPRWQKGAPAVVTVTLENRSGRKIEVTSIPAFQLDNYWCPVDLRKDGRPLGANERCALALASGASLTARYDLSELGWDNTVSSAWPADSLYTLVSEGKYRLHLDIELTGGKEPKHVESNAVEVHIEK